MNGIRGLAAVALLLAGCKLIDQTTFAPSPEATPSAAQLAKVDARTALLTINYTEPSPSYQDVLRYAVRTAETRAPGVQYDVIAILPSGADMAAAQRRASEVMRSIMDQGVADNRIHLGLRSAPAGSPQEIRVYVR
jgi:type IV pilus biogenesis protein CpaD/CtpE